MVREKIRVMVLEQLSKAKGMLFPNSCQTLQLSVTLIKEKRRNDGKTQKCKKCEKCRVDINSYS